VSSPVSKCGKMAGTTCQERPYLSFSQPQALSSPPADSLLQK
jgi:hypothetical protein